ncbi:MAG: alpha/beta hydrolase [Rhizobiaceae bacterium]|nr:alpha/beta hydrolase [Rhizobiaceae bacterium]MCV0407584.1 alpha/beta hydrolase [Rhizobiaceae bacterium]
MNLATALAAFLLAAIFLLVGITRIGAWMIERRFPPVGGFAEIGGARIHYLHVPAHAGADLPPVVFIHGASSNLRDQMTPFRRLLEGRAELLFLDRPGHGWSGRGVGNDTPDKQAGTIVGLMRHVGIERAIIVGHSFGAAVTTSLAVEHPEAVAGLVLLAPASHPWPGGGTSWYNDLAARPLLGRLFASTLAYPAAKLRIRAATDCVFSPNRAPAAYLDETGIELVLRPAAFRANSIDVAGLYRHVVGHAPRYPEIAAPTVVVTGDRDKVVYEEIHSEGLARDIAGARLVRVRNLGHKPDWVAPDLAIAAIETVAGRSVDLDAVARAVEARIADDAFGPETECPDLGPPMPVGDAG